jgi:hypothetical protein
MEFPAGSGRKVSDVSHPLEVVAPCVLGALCVVAAPSFIVVREWWWNRDRRRRVAAMLHRELAVDEAQSLLTHQMTVQLEEIRALPEVGFPSVY